MNKNLIKLTISVIAMLTLSGCNLDNFPKSSISSGITEVQNKSINAESSNISIDDPSSINSSDEFFNDTSNNDSSEEKTDYNINLPWL